MDYTVLKKRLHAYQAFQSFKQITKSAKQILKWDKSVATVPHISEQCNKIEEDPLVHSFQKTVFSKYHFLVSDTLAIYHHI